MSAHTIDRDGGEIKDNNDESQSQQPIISPTWRSLVEQSLVKKRQTPLQQRQTIVRLLAKTAAPLPVKLPKLPFNSTTTKQHHAAETPRGLKREMRHQFAESKEQLGLHQNAEMILAAAINQAKRKLLTQTSSSSASSASAALARNNRRIQGRKSKRNIKSQSDTEESKESLLVEISPEESISTISHINSPVTSSSTISTILLPLTKSSSSSPSTDYTIHASDPSELYKPFVSKLEQLPLELFDNEEGDLTGEEWIQLGNTKYKGEGTPAKALYYDHQVWNWQPCRAIAYDSITHNFTIMFPHSQLNVNNKSVKRLSLLFDDEDRHRFGARLQHCRSLREECLAIRRYTSFVNSQSSTLFSPIQSATLHGVMGKLMLTSATQVLRKQVNVERLLNEVKDEYSRAMKGSIIDYKRKDPIEESKMQQLRLPPLIPAKAAPYLAVIATPQPRYIPFLEALNRIGEHHYTHNPEASQVLLALYRSWDSLHSAIFYDLHYNPREIMQPADSAYPMPLPDYINHQQQHFMLLRERCQNDWRALLINLIRDNLNTVFKLFVNDAADYEKSDLKRFLGMCGFILRDQLNHLIRNSVEQWKVSMEDYSGVVKEIEHKNGDKNIEEIDVLDGYLNDALPSTPITATRSVMSPKSSIILPSPPCLFVFQLTLAASSPIINFLPPLTTLQPSLLSLLALPSKLTSLTHIDSDVVPLLGLTDRSLINDTNGAELNGLIQNTGKRTGEIIDENLKQPLALAKKYQRFADKLHINMEQYVQQWFTPTETATSSDTTIPTSTPNTADDPAFNSTIVAAHTLEETQVEMNGYQQLISEIQAISPNQCYFRLIRCDVHLLKNALITKATEMIQLFLLNLHQQLMKQVELLEFQYMEIIEKLNQKNHDVYEMHQLQSYVTQLENITIHTISTEISYIMQKLTVMEEFHYLLPVLDYHRSLTIKKFPLQLYECIWMIKKQILLDTTVFKTDMEGEKQQLLNELEMYDQLVESFSEFGLGNGAQMEQNGAKVENLAENLEKAEKLVETFHQRHLLFGEATTDFTALLNLRQKFTPYCELWSTTTAFNSSHAVWMMGPFTDLDAESMNTDVHAYYKMMIKLEKFFMQENLLKPMKVATEMKNKLMEFKSNLPMIIYLRTPGLRTRHWEKLQFLINPQKTVNLTGEIHDGLTLNQLLALNISMYKNEIEEICISAEKEYHLELLLDKMLKEWKNMNFQLDTYKNQLHTYTLKNAEEILTLLDDQLMKTQAIKGSPYIKFFETRVKKWEIRLQLISSIMEEWLICQKTWQYLEPIFSSEDIMRQMPVEGRRFGVVDQYWRKTMEQAKKIGNIMDFVSESEGILKTLQESNKMLDLIGKHLNEYLETKRLAFPRFYFLSNDELLSILSQTKNAQAVQPHLSKCFDAMNSLIFQGEKENAVISAMQSAEGEVVPFLDAIDPNVGAKRGNVEIWLKEVEDGMKDSLKDIMTKAMATYPKSRRESWILEQPGQIVLAVTSTYWTKDVTRALTDGKKGLISYLNELNSQLEALVGLVRRHDITPLQRLTLAALTVVDVHARDVVARLIEEQVKNENDFEWLAQMRYYYESDTSIQMTPRPGTAGQPRGLVKVKMLNTCLDYGYEYLGNTSRLVITPLTDRCYRTLMGAIHLHLGGAPEGPAGTGKTETVKDLAKAVAQMAIVFNCSDALNFKAMAKFFKGLCCAGAWSCFDEFNRIDLEVLSVIAQQISSIQRAIQENKHTFVFEGVNIPLIHTCSVFITMNPGYAGRSELPDNLKALFRSVAMMIPDYAMIAEIVLYSYGYSKARLLARKLVACLRLSSEQLSSQDHYDFGMRNVKSILTAAGKLKQDHPEEEEEWLTVMSIKNCNEPKFVSDDIPLFHGIVKDLFPTVEMKETKHEALISTITETLAHQRYQYPSAFLHKCIELYDTVLVRHGIMMVGKTFSGKSTAIKTLATSLTTLHHHNPQDPTYNTVDVGYINPKSVTVDELYGAENAAGEWVQGIVPTVMGDMVHDWQSTRHWKWMVFDGPVDAVWIENMNTVLDDNKKLCLASGEQIKLSPNMSMMFEVEDLAQASPATVSRCGMVYMEPAGLGYNTLIETWLQSLPQPLIKYISDLRTLCSWLLPPSLHYINHQCTAIIQVGEMAMVSNFTKLMSSLLDEVAVVWEELQQQELIGDLSTTSREGMIDAININGKDSGLSVGQNLHQLESVLPQWLECIVMFAVVWSIGSNSDTSSRNRFSVFFNDLITGRADDPEYSVTVSKQHVHRKVKLSFPTSDESDRYRETTVFDYHYDSSLHRWIYWLSNRQEYVIPANAKFNDIIVPTIDTIRNEYLLHSLITHHHHVLMVGATGTAKSITAQAKLLRGLDRSVFIPQFLAFSARTTAGGTQDLIDSKLERRRLGVMGPPASKRCVIFVDDLNMPARDTYGAQPPIELLRQWMDYGGWYEKKAKTFKSIVDVQFLAAMGPPGGGRNPITQRFTRHLFHLTLNPYDQSSLKLIFNTIMSNWLQPFPGAIQQLQSSLVDATVLAYTTLTKELLPTPAKSHYTFNLRDVSKVFQGIMQVDQEDLHDPIDVVRLWCHECTRVFGDRLIDNQDIRWFQSLINLHIQETFQIELNQVFSASNRFHQQPAADTTAISQSRRQIFADFSNPKSTKKHYVEIRDVDSLAAVVENYLHEYNNVNTNGMNLVLFTEAIDHIARISRIIRQPFGNALLVGVGGSGRQSLTRLAAFIADYDCFAVEITKNYSINEWREDLRSMMKKAGLNDKRTVFLFNEAQATSESFIEDINSILSNGEVPNLFPAEDLVPIIEAILPEARKAGKADNNATIFSFFVERCRANIHVVLCVSPIGSNFRNRLRMFPSLVNCTTIDWFHPWPTEALKQVATHFLRDVNLEPSVKTGVVDVCVDMQERVNTLSVDYYQSLRRYNYVTPTSYLELIKLFRQLFETTRSQIQNQQNRYGMGLTKLNDTEIQVKAMQAQLEALKPQLIVSSKETEELMITIATRTEQVTATRAVVGEEEKECNRQAAEATAIKEDCEEQLKEALPALAQAMNALRVLKKSALDELKAMKVPTQGVILTIEALCIMMGIPPKKVGQVGSKSDDYWTPAKQKLLSDPQLFQKLQSYDKDNIPTEVIEKVRPYCKNPDFAPAKIAKASQAAEGFCKWVLAMEVYDRVVKQIEPKRIALKEAEEKLAIASAQLAAKKQQLAEVEALLSELNLQLEVTTQKKISLEFQVKECSERLDRAEKLLGGLSSEKIRWGEKVKQLSSDFTNVVGNILISSGVIAYLGVFTIPYREACVQEWLTLLRSKHIPSDQQFSLSRILGDPMLIRQWGIWTLPKDNFSIDNAIILTKSMRWGLIIDPQEQANRWIKNMEDDKLNLKVIKQSDENFSKILMTSIQLGTPILIENINESLDPLLEPLLLRQTFKQGNNMMIKLGNETIPYHDDFRLYLTSKLPNPHYSPEISTKVTVINMMITPEGLEDQMLSTVVSNEEPELEMERSELIVKNAENARQLSLIENKILEKLNESKGNILDDEDLITTLQKSKSAAKLIEKRVAAALKTEENINKIRMSYSHVAFTSANLFFCISDLNSLDPMYQYSLTWFHHLFLKSIKESDKSLDVHVRTSNIEQKFLKVLYANVCRSLFEKDKLLFSFMLCLKVLQGKGTVTKEELRFLLTGGDVLIDGTIIDNPTRLDAADDEEEEEEQDDDEEEEEDSDEEEKHTDETDHRHREKEGSSSGISNDPSNNTGHWLTDQQWNQITQLSTFTTFFGLSQHIVHNQHKWHAFYDHHDPLNKPFPAKWDHLSLLHKLMILRCFRQDKLVVAIKHVVSGVLGGEFITPPPFDLHSAYADSNACTPLIFVLSPGVDVASEVLKLAAEFGMNTTDKFFSISLGQGQGPLAEAAIREAIDKGSWVLLANCHLLQSWLPTLQKIIDELDPKTTNDKFRLWLTSMPCAAFPVSILQNGIKITNEPPKGIKANLIASYRNLDEKLLESTPQKTEEIKRFYFGLSLFHAILQERKSYGAIGFNRSYEFTESDLIISQKQIKALLEGYNAIPYKAMQYLIGQLNYGGRVTDDWDRRTLMNILDDFIAPSMLMEEVKIDSKGLYLVPAINADLSEYRAVIQEMPNTDESEIFGFHQNVTITCAIKEAQEMLNTLLTLQPRSGAIGGLTREEKIAKLAQEIESTLPQEFNIAEAAEKFPVSYSESMNTVLVQELIRYNRLLSRVKATLKDVQKAVAGTVVMSEELEQTAAALYDNQVPVTWSTVAYPSLKPLGSWVSDFKRRLAMFHHWLQNGPPTIYWLSGFFFTQSFLTGTMQNYARKQRIPIDECGFTFEVRSDIPIPNSTPFANTATIGEEGKVTPIHPPEDGVYIYGLYLEGARWDNSTNQLAESYRRQLYSEMPVIHFKPTLLKNMDHSKLTYTCPVYKTSRRAGTLSTTGHSTNFVLSLQLNSAVEEKHWVKRGVALLTQLDQ